MRQPDPTKSEAPTAATVEASVNVPSEHDHQETSIANPTVSVPANQIQAIVGELVQEDGRIYTTSMQVAEHFGKRHADVLRAIKKLACSQEFTERNFAQCLKINELANGKTEPYFRITRDGFVFLAMGFTGKEAAAWKEAYIVAFNKMEAELKRIKYAVNPDDALTAAQAETLRPMLKTKADLLPKRQQGSFMMKGWSKLKSHYKVGYRQIPQSEYTEAMSIVARHATEWEVLDALPKAGQYHFPLETADPHDRWIGNAWLTPRVLIDPKNRKPELELIAQLEADGNDVTGARLRVEAMHLAMEQVEDAKSTLRAIRDRLGPLVEMCSVGSFERGKNVLFSRPPDINDPIERHVFGRQQPRLKTA